MPRVRRTAWLQISFLVPLALRYAERDASAAVRWGPILLLVASVSAPMHPFRQGLLSGLSIALSGDVPHEVSGLLEALGARVMELGSKLGSDEERLAARVQSAGPFDALVCGQGGSDALLTDTWAIVRAVATQAFIPKRGGRIVLLAPSKRRGVVAAALENLARTLSVEWARFNITTVAIAPAAAIEDEELAQLVAYLCSPAGAYYSGCRIELGAVDRESRR